MTAIALTDLPATIGRYLSAHGSKNVEGALDEIAADASITDIDETFHGRAEIRSWLDTSSHQFRYTMTPLSADQTDDAHVTVVQRLEGDFPGGVVELSFNFTIAGGVIEELVIAQ